MPDVTIRNETPYTLNIALTQVAPLHFANAVKPDSVFKTHTGSVWFTVEWCIDNIPERTLQSDAKTVKKAIAHSNRYSAKRSARTIAIVSAAGLSVLVLAGPAALAAAAAAGSATAAALLASSAVLSAATTAEAIAFSSYAATTLTASALETIQEEAGVSPDKSAKIQKNLDILSKTISASSVGGAALKGTKKAVITAGSALVSRMAARSTKQANVEAEVVAKEHLLPPGTRERVFGVYISFKPRKLAIREAKNDKGDPHFELWDTDTKKRLN